MTSMLRSSSEARRNERTRDHVEFDFQCSRLIVQSLRIAPMFARRRSFENHRVHGIALRAEMESADIVFITQPKAHLR